MEALFLSSSPLFCCVSYVLLQSLIAELKLLIFQLVIRHKSHRGVLIVSLVIVWGWYCLSRLTWGNSIDLNTCWVCLHMTVFYARQCFDNIGGYKTR